MTSTQSVTMDDALWHSARAVIFDTQHSARPDEKIMEPQIPAIQLRAHELSAATDGFSERQLVGAGSFGCVFRATKLQSLAHQGPVAIKNLLPGNEEDARREIELLANCHHPNLLPLLGFSHSPKCLVYPLMGVLTSTPASRAHVT